MYKGVDVSSIQQNVDWQWLFEQGITWCVIRNGLGNNQHDPLTAQNVAGAKAAGLKVALYNVIYPLPSSDPVAEAQYHYNLAPDKSIPVAVDEEFPLPQDWAARGISAQSITDWTQKYLDEYERLSGQKCIFYSYLSYIQALHLPTSFSVYPLWLADYVGAPPKAPAPWSNWTMWQWAGGTALKLPNGAACDTDYAVDLSLWGVSDTPTPSPQPNPEPSPPPVVVPPAPVPEPAPPPPPVSPTPPTNEVSFWMNLLTTVFNFVKQLFAH
jgi:hypothetical protein